MLRKLLVAAAIALGLAVPAATAAPTVIEGEKNGAPYRIVVPENWNGTLVVHAHGYRDLADHPGEVDDRSAPASPSPALEPALLAQGYALAGSAYKTNGWAVDEGIEDTRALVWRFRSAVGKASRTLPCPKLIAHGSLLKNWASTSTTDVRMRSARNVVLPLTVSATGT